MIPSTCGGPNCKAPIEWVLTMAGKRLPIDRGSRQMRVVMHQLPEGGERAAMVATYTPHWATCPDRERFTRRKAAG